ncbi:hypothetical protein [Coprobacter secundus]|uniref:hypothetical protein n=1 Tax=Coprobacter secundus TaxID=1501392 RepID=UPI00387EBE02
MKNDLPAGGLRKGEGLPIRKRDKSSCPLSSVREHYTKRAGKARVSEARLSIRLCGFPEALFTKNSQPYPARLAFRGMCRRKGI